MRLYANYAIVGLMVATVLFCASQILTI